MEELPPELSARRQGIYDRVVGAGRTRRRRRIAALVTVTAVIVAVPVAAVALSGTDNPRPRIALENPSTTLSIPDASTTTDVPTASTTEPTTTSVAPTTEPSTVDTQPVVVPSTEPTTSTSLLVCRNNKADEACGPFHYDPPITNEPAALVVVKVEPAHPKVGEEVTFTLRATDADSEFYPFGMWCNGGSQEFGDGNQGASCIADCVFPGYGPWDPPAVHPSDITVKITHTYAEAGTYRAQFTGEADVCGSRTSDATASVRVTVTATTPTT
jgi:hypothetical protein